MHAFCVQFECDQLHNVRRLRQLCCRNTIYSISIFSLCKKITYNFATTKLVLLPGLAPGSKSLLSPKKMNFYCSEYIQCDECCGLGLQLSYSGHCSRKWSVASLSPHLMRCNILCVLRWNIVHYYSRAVFDIWGISSRVVAIRQRSWRRFFCAYMLPICNLCVTPLCVLLSVVFFIKKIIIMRHFISCRAWTQFSR